MVMQYLISRNEEYLRHIENFNSQIAEILELIKVLEYNISEVQMYLKTVDSTTDEQKNEAWFGKQS